MQTQITARNFNASPELRTYVQERLAKLERFYDGITGAQVTLTKENTVENAKSVDITLRVYRRQLSAQQNAATHEEAIDQCVDRLRRQLIKYKDKLRSKDKNVQH